MESRFEGITEEGTSYAFRIDTETNIAYLRFICTKEDRIWFQYGNNNSNGKGILQQIREFTEPKQVKYSSLTYEMLESCIKDIQERYNNKPKQMQVWAWTLYAMPDDMFIAFCNNPNIECIGGSEAINKVTERMKKLGIYDTK